MAGILVIGSLNMDLVIETPTTPVFGETVFGSGFLIAPGGKGANQAVAAARLGAEVAMVGCIGNDTFGHDLLANLKTNRVEVQGIQTLEDIPTGVAVIVVKEGNNFIIVNSGANYSLTPRMVEANEPLIKASSILILQFEVPVECVERAIHIAKRYDTRVLLNPAPAKKLPEETLAKVDIITPNEFECEAITGRPVKSIADAQEALGYFTSRGVKQVLITLGSQGVVYNRANQIVHNPACPVETVDTTAAGDAFSAAIAVAFSEGMDVDSAVDFGNAVGALTVTRRGAQPSLPTRPEVNHFLEVRTIAKECKQR
jgi:ribokinase